jgi:prepilin-type N-terminal cleavage/methylation domain-containing protein
MASLRGFSLIEVLVVLGVSALVIGVAAIAPVASFSRLSIQSDRETLVTALLYARSSASAGGVLVRNDEFVVFYGPSYSERREDADYPFQRAVATEGDAEFLFSNQVVEERTLIHSDYRISVSPYGRIEDTTLLP